MPLAKKWTIENVETFLKFLGFEDEASAFRDQVDLLFFYTVLFISIKFCYVMMKFCDFNSCSKLNVKILNVYTQVCF